MNKNHSKLYAKITEKVENPCTKPTFCISDKSPFSPTECRFFPTNDVTDNNKSEIVMFAQKLMIFLTYTKGVSRGTDMLRISMMQ